MTTPRASTDSSPTRRRWVRLATIAAAAIAAALAVCWYLWLPNWRPQIAAGERYGIDVSSHQGSIEWGRVADDGIAFVYIKATEGGDFVDVRFRTNWMRSAEAGLVRGAYHFFTLCTPAEEQARNFLAVAPPEVGALPPAVDLELAGNCSARPDAAVVDAEVRSFLRIIEGAWGREALLYVGNDFESRYPARHLGRPLWLRSFLVRPSGDEWLVWQLHGYAHVDGVNGSVDLDVMRPAT